MLIKGILSVTIIIAIAVYCVFITNQIKKIDCKIIKIYEDEQLTNRIREKGRRCSLNQQQYFDEKERFYSYPHKHFPEMYFDELCQNPDSFYCIEIQMKINNKALFAMKNIELDAHNQHCLWQGSAIVSDDDIINIPYYSEGKREVDYTIRLFLYEPTREIDKYLADPSQLALYLHFQFGLLYVTIPVL